MTYCMGQNCDRKETCERYIKTTSPSVIEQIVDFSTSGSGQCNRDGILISPYCGLNSKYDYYIQKNNLNSIIEVSDDNKIIINIPKEYTSNIKEIVIKF